MRTPNFFRRIILKSFQLAPAMLLCILFHAASASAVVQGGSQVYSIAPAVNWRSVSAGSAHIVAIKSDGTLWAWGWNYNGQLGNGSLTNEFFPVQIGTATNWQSVSAGGSHTVAIKRDGTLWAWGYNGWGQLGDGSFTDRTTPVQIGTATNWQSVSAGGIHTIAIKGDGTLWAWGSDSSGQVGDGTNSNSITSPVQIGTATNWQSVSAGYSHTEAIKGDGTLWAWGNNGFGQLGDGSAINKSSPVQIGTTSNWQSVSAGGGYTAYTVAIKRDGTLWAWGYNGNGQLGDGSYTHRTSPVQIGTATNWQSVAAGYYHTEAIKGDGTLWAWGYNHSGQLGNGSTTDIASPVQIGTATNWQSVSVGGENTVAIKGDGTVWAWGNNSSGQLGVGGTTNRTSPVQVENFTIIASVAGGNGTVNCTSPVNIGTTSSCTITPASGYQLTTFTDNGVDQKGAVSAGSYSISNVTSPHTISATFNAYHAISASPGTNGSITPAGTTSVIQGGSQAYSIAPAVGYHILDVLVDGVSVGAVGSYSFSTVTASHTISATFAINSYTITASSGPNGSISPAGTTSVSHGGSLTCTISPAANFHILDVLVDGVSVGAVSGYTFASVTGSHNISATFDLLSSGDIITVAGGGTGVASQATAANLALPSGVAFDDKGNFYIADTNNHLVRMVDPAGVMTTVAGDGSAGYSGDGGAATKSSLYSPTGVAIDRTGNLYIADSSNNRIRMVDASGIISTVAGDGSSGYYGDRGIARKAGLSMPSAVAVDGNGILYIADTKNSVIRMVDPSGIIYTAAGTGTQGYSGDGGTATSADLSAPFGIAVDGNGAFYIADTGNSVIRMVDSSGIISTVAGNGTPGYSGDGGTAWKEQLKMPSGVAVDGVGALYIADTNNQRIRMVDTSGTITTVAGIGSPGFSGDGGPATAAQLYTPSGIAVDKTGTFYIADASNNRIRMVVSLTPDTSPDPFTFIDQGNVALNSSVISGAIVINGINAPAPLSITGGEYSINGGQFFATAGVIANGDSLRVRLQASGSYATVRSATLQIGGMGDIFSVTTLPPPTYPVTTTPVTNGSITSSGGGTVPHGSSTTFTIIPNSGYTLSGLTDNGTSVLALAIEAPPGTFSYTISNVTAPHSIEATFALQSGATPVPALGPWGVLAAAVGLGVFAQRRRKSKTV